MESFCRTLGESSEICGNYPSMKNLFIRKLDRKAFILRGERQKFKEVFLLKLFVFKSC